MLSAGITIIAAGFSTVFFPVISLSSTGDDVSTIPGIGHWRQLISTMSKLAPHSHFCCRYLAVSVYITQMFSLPGSAQSYAAPIHQPHTFDRNALGLFGPLVQSLRSKTLEVKEVSWRHQHTLRHLATPSMWISLFCT